jgi:tRNA U34 5-carboxymethylaminomethyl modifying GTPase MnmE/TrmE
MSTNKEIIISESILQSIEFISAPLHNLVDKYREALQTADVPTLAVFGLLKAGKSTFLNALTDDLDNSRFAHGAVRTTIKNQLFYYNGINILDTPGIDANDQDTAIALKGLDSTDIFLFIHNPLCGELDKQEVELLQSVFNFYPNSKMLIQNMICILTHKASLNDVNQAIIVQRIQTQFNEYFGYAPQICLVESLSYFKARKENKKNLLEKCGMRVVWEAVMQKIPNLISVKIEKQKKLKKEIKKLLNEEKSKIQKEIEKAEHTMTSVTNEVNILRTKIKQF